MQSVNILSSIIAVAAGEAAEGDEGSSLSFLLRAAGRQGGRAAGRQEMTE